MTEMNVDCFNITFTKTPVLIFSKHQWNGHIANILDKIFLEEVINNIADYCVMPIVAHGQISMLDLRYAAFHKQAISIQRIPCWFTAVYMACMTPQGLVMVDVYDHAHRQLSPKCNLRWWMMRHCKNAVSHSTPRIAYNVSCNIPVLRLELSQECIMQEY